MRSQVRITTAAVLVLLGLTSCNGVMDVTPKDQFADEAVFTDPNLAQASVNDMYRGLGHGLYEIMLASITDETHFIHNYATEPVVKSIITSSDRGAIDDGRFAHFNWGPTYSRIRQTNIFLSRIDATTFDAAWKRRMKGEAFFLRAYFYHNLMRMYGGVPIITKVYDLNEDYQVARNTFQETVAFIVANADSAAALLPLSYSGVDVGRATKGAALALKARVLLYAASALYTANPSRQPENGYTTGQDPTALWRAAKDAAKAVMDLGVYSLFRPSPANAQEAAKNYGDLFLQTMSDEVILSRFFLSTRDDGYNPGLHNGPNGFHTWGGNTPIQNLVDDYRMADGSKFAWTNPVEAGAPYANRDPRFYASIAYDGAPWRPRPDDVKGLDPVGFIQTFRQLTIRNDSGRVTDVVPGLDTRDSPVENWNGAYSGYYIRKFVDPSINAQFIKEQVPWIFFRYAEVLLNYAEASIELNELGDALTVLNQIRVRAWDDKMYFMPIRFDELNRNGLLKQNPGY